MLIWSFSDDADADAASEEGLVEKNRSLGLLFLEEEDVAVPCCNGDNEDADEDADDDGGGVKEVIRRRKLLLHALTTTSSNVWNDSTNTHIESCRDSTVDIMNDGICFFMLVLLCLSLCSL